MKRYEVLSEELKDFAFLEDFQKEDLADCITCPNSDNCEYDGINSDCCTSCKIKWLEEDWADE